MNTNRQLIYQDPQAEIVLAELAAILEKHDFRLLCSVARPVPGLPVFSGNEATEWDPTLGKYVTSTSWGKAVPLHGRELGSYRVYDVAPLYRPHDSSVPPAQMPEQGHAVIDPITGIVTVFAGPEAVFDTHIASLDGKTGKECLAQVRVDLARAGVPVYPGEMWVEASLRYPWQNEGGFAATYAANREIAVPLVGYALDPHRSEMVYVHIAGAKTALRSIWGTLNNGGAQCISIVDGGERQYAFSTHNYATFSDTLDEDTNLYRMVVADRRALEQEVENRAYLVIPDGGEFDLYQVFAARLNAVLPIPVLPEWGKRLYRHGIEDEELLAPCLCGGDVAKAFSIGRKGWIEAIERLIRDGELSITIE